MGNQLNAQKLKSNLTHYKPNLSSYQLITSKTNPLNLQDNTLFVWQHKKTLQSLIQKKYFIRTWIQFHQLLDMFALRYNDPFIVSTKYLNVESSAIETLETSSVFPQVWVSIFFEQTLTNLSCFDEIPQEDGAYFLLQSLKGFQKLTQKTNFFFQVKQEMFHITNSRQLKLWFSENICQSRGMESGRPLSNESQMVYQVLQIIQKNICFCTQSQRNLDVKGQNFIQPIVIDELIRKAPQTFNEAIQLAEGHLESDEVQVGNQMACLKNLSQDQIVKIFEVAKNKTKLNDDGNSILTAQNGANMPQPIHYNQFQSQSYTINLTESEISRRLQTNSAVKYFERQQKGFQNEISMRVSRDRSNRKSGLSLVKNSKDQQTENRRNHNSLLVIKPRPNSSVNQHSRVTLLKGNEGLPPMSRNVSFNMKTTNQNDCSQVNPFVANKKPLVKRSNSLLNGHQSKGITITNRTDSAKKGNNVVVGINQNNMADNMEVRNSSQNSGLILRLNNEGKRQIQNQESSISIVNFPHPVYPNNSMATSNNYHQIIPNQTFSSNMSFDPLLPNQSLTRFQKEFVTNSNANSSTQQFYEIPKIYVHSPKTKHQIYRLDSIKPQMPDFQPYAHERQRNFVNGPTLERHPNEKVISNYAESQSSEKTLQKNNKLDQYQSYIHENQSVFTHPVLYEYITNQTKTQFINNQKPKTAKPYIDYLANVQISESLDYNTVQKIFQANNQRPQHQKVQNKKENSPHQYSINDFATIEEIQENPNDQPSDKQNLSFVPIHLNLAPQPNIPLCPPSSVRRGYEESVVVEYKKFYDDTNRSNNSPNKHYFSPLKKNNILINQTQQIATNEDRKKYATANNWQTAPSKPLIQRPNSVHPLIHQHNQINQVNEQRNISPSPMSKVIYRGEKPSINPLLMQDIQKIRQNRMY